MDLKIKAQAHEYNSVYRNKFSTKNKIYSFMFRSMSGQVEPQREKS